MNKIYFMIYDLGMGHRSTAKALQEVIEKRQFPWQIHIVDVFKEIIGTSTPQDLYNNLILQKNWAKLINEPLLLPFFKLQIRLRHSAWLALLKNYWNQHKPDMVVSVLPLVNRVLYESLQATLPGVPFVTLITDYADCPPHFWIERQEQFLICPSERAVEQAKNFGHTEERIFRTSAVVINPKFYKPIPLDRRIERQRLGLDPDLPTGLVMFGSNGSKVMLEIVQCLEQASLNLQLILLCGRNEKLASTLRHSQGRLPRFVETFTSEIPYYMHLADFFVCKPGAVGVSEAVAMNLPIITDCNALTAFQERASSAWIADNEIGIVVRNFRKIDQAVAELIHPETLARFRTNAAALNNQAVFEVIDILSGILKRAFLTQYGSVKSS